MSSSEDLSAGKPASSEFDAAIAALEEASGDFLTRGPGRTRMEAAFERDPEAFAHLVRKTLAKRGADRLLGLFVRIVDDEHSYVSARLAAARAAAERTRAEYDALSTRVATGEGPGYFTGDEVWLRAVGAHLDDVDDLRAMLEERHIATQSIEQLVELWHELRGERAA